MKSAPRMLFSRKRRPLAQIRDIFSGMRPRDRWFRRARSAKKLGIAPARGFYAASSKPFPAYWRNIVPALADLNDITEKRINGWLLVLAAKRIPHIFFPGHLPRITVPSLCEGVALHEIRAFEAEYPKAPYLPPAYPGMWAIVLLLALLAVCHGIRFAWFSSAVASFLPEAERWPAAFGADAYRIRVLHQWWRTITALFLHADTAHLAGNVAFGFVFLTPLFRRVGAGAGFFLTIFSGVLGNVGNAFFSEAHMLSIGFSTALFGGMGSLTMLTCQDVLHTTRLRLGVISAFGHIMRQSIVPVGAGLALLALLGGGGEARVDYSAHVWGFFSGFFLSCVVFMRRTASISQGWIQSLAAGGAMLCIVTAWWYAVAVSL